MPIARIAFMGTADLACFSLDLLSTDPRFELAGVVTQPDRPRGRDLKLQPGSVKRLAMERNIPVLQPLKARDPAFLEALRQWSPDLVVVVAFGQILPQAVLDLPRHGCLNVHTSLLPKYRGAAPIQWALLNGDRETGVTIMKMDAGLDTGPILSTRIVPIEPSDNSQTLHDRLGRTGAELLADTIPDYLSGRIVPVAQPESGASYARKITRDDGRIDWTMPSAPLLNRFRAFTPWPGFFSTIERNGRPVLIKIHEVCPAPELHGEPGAVIEAGPEGIVVACGDAALRVTRLQREGGRSLPAREFLSGFPLSAGDRFS